MGTLYDWSTTPASNTTIDGINVAENCPAANINNSIRSMAALIRNTFTSNLQTFLAGSAALGVAYGGTGLTGTPTNGQLAVGNGTGFTLANITAGSGVTVTNAAGSITIAATGSGGTVTSVDASGGTTGFSFTGGPITGTGTLTLSGTLIAANGGTGFSSYTVGDILFAGTTTTFSKLSGVATGNALISGGVGTAPSYGKIGLATHVSGQLGLANGGTGGTDAATARTGLGLGTIATFDETTAAQFRSNTAGKALSTDKVWSAAAEVTLTDAATVAVDMSTFFNGVVTLGGNRTLGNPTNTKDGQTGRIRIVQDGTGSRTLAYASNWKFAGGTAPTLSTAAGAVDVLYYDVISSTFIFASLNKALA